MRTLIRSAVVAPVAVLLVAGVVDAKLAANKLAANKLAANKLAANKLAANKLAANKLSDDRFSLNGEGVAELLATDEGREVLGFIVSCAMPGETTLVAEAPGGGTYEFFGEIGLAKGWLNKPLKKAGRRWVSACLLARVNNANIPNPISLRGPHRALEASPEETAGWTLEEGAFYGDYFTGDEPAVTIACRGEDQAAAETGGLIERDCAEPDPGDPTHTQCGFTYAGDCGDFAPARACKTFAGAGFYKSCHPQPIGTPSSTFRQVITVFAAP